MSDSGRYTFPKLNENSTPTFAGLTLTGNFTILKDSGTATLDYSAPSGVIAKYGRNDATMESGERIGVLRFTGDDGATDAKGGEFECEAFGTWAANDFPSRFFWSLDNAGSLTEVMSLEKTGLSFKSTNGPSILNEDSANTNPVFCTDKNNPTYGIGGAAGGNISLIIAGSTIIRAQSSGGIITGDITISKDIIISNMQVGAGTNPGNAGELWADSNDGFTVKLGQ